MHILITDIDGDEMVVPSDMVRLSQHKNSFRAYVGLDGEFRSINKEEFDKLKKALSLEYRRLYAEVKDIELRQNPAMIVGENEGENTIEQNSIVFGKNHFFASMGGIQKRKGSVKYTEIDPLWSNSRTLEIIMKHIKPSEVEKGVINFPFNCENFCREMDELLKDNFAP